MVPCPEIMITSGGLSKSRIFCSVSSPSIPGSHTSSSTTSKLFFSSRRRQASPLSASSVRKPSSSSTPRRESRMPDSPPTIRMLDILDRGGRHRRFGGKRQFYDEPRPHWLVLVYTNGAAVIFVNAAPERAPQPGTSLFWRRKGPGQS